MSTPELPAVRVADAGSGCADGTSGAGLDRTDRADSAATDRPEVTGSETGSETEGGTGIGIPWPATAGPGTAAGGVMGEPQRFVVSAPSSVLARLLAGMATDPAVDVLAVSGPADRPRRAVVRMSDRLAAAISSGPDPVVVEPDIDLAAPAPPAPSAPPASFSGPPAPPAGSGPSGQTTQPVQPAHHVQPVQPQEASS